jgi:hypothetical protein
MSGVNKLNPIKEDKTLKTTFGALFLICLATSAFADDNPIGFQASTLPDA